MKTQVFTAIGEQPTEENLLSQFLDKCKPNSKPFCCQVAWAQINMHGMASLYQLAWKCNHFAQHALFSPRALSKMQQPRDRKAMEQCKGKQKDRLKPSN